MPDAEMEPLVATATLKPIQGQIADTLCIIPSTTRKNKSWRRKRPILLVSQCSWFLPHPQSILSMRDENRTNRKWGTGWGVPKFVRGFWALLSMLYLSLACLWPAFQAYNQDMVQAVVELSLFLSISLSFTHCLTIACDTPFWTMVWSRFVSLCASY